MNLTPEERQAGKENFDVNRRDFLKHGAMAGAVGAVGLGAFYFGYEASLANPVRVGVIGTGDEGSVLIGAINPNFIDVRSIADIRPYNEYRAFHGDVSSPAAEKARPGLLKKYGWSTEHAARKHVEVYGPWQELIANAKADHIEAVIIALPLHLHAQAAIVAMRHGLHVLTEKLMGHSVTQCKEMARVAKETGKHLATGHQRHYNILYEEAVDQIKRGLLGDLHYIRAQWHRGNMPGSDSWQQPMPYDAKPTDKLAKNLGKKLRSWKDKLNTVSGPEIEAWAKKVRQLEAQIADEVLAAKDKSGKTLAEKYQYEHEKLNTPDGKGYDRPAVEELIRWRLWDRTGGGLMAELGSHQLDAASIFINAIPDPDRRDEEKKHPLSVVAAGDRPVFPVDRDVNDHVYCLFEFPAPGKKPGTGYDPKDPLRSRKKIGVQYASINGNGFGGYGEIVFGTKGTLLLEREQEAILLLDKSKSKVAVDRAVLDTQASGPAQEAVAGAVREVSRGYTEEEEHWAWCIRNPSPENRPRCHPKVALGDAVIALTTNMAAQKGLRVEFKEDWFDPESDATPEKDVLGLKDAKPNINRQEYKKLT